jgi:hypothetical protein
MDGKKHHSKKFNYSISGLDDVVKHLDSLWKLHNDLAAATKLSCSCTDPPCDNGEEHGHGHGDDDDQN